MKNHLKQALGLAVGLALVGQGTVQATDTAPTHDHLGTSRAVSIGFRLNFSFGGQTQADWRDRMEYSFAYRMDETRGGFASRPTTGYSADLFAVRFKREGFDRFTLSGRDLYLTDKGIRFHAEGEEADGEGGGSTVLWIGLGLAGLVGIGAAAGASAGEDLGQAVGCAITSLVGDNCDT